MASPNPRGRPRRGCALAEIIRELADPHEMVERAMAIIRSDNDSLALQAMAWLAANGYQRPAERHEIAAVVTGNVYDWSAVPLEERRALLAQLRQAQLQASSTSGD